MTRSFTNPIAFRQSLEERLKTIAKERDTPLNTLRLKLVLERMLARLFSSEQPGWLLKGGYAMELRYRPKARTTRDIDLSISDSGFAGNRQQRLADIRERLQNAVDIDLGDFLTFRIAAASAELSGAPQGGARFPVQALMAGRVFGRFHIDVGIGDAISGLPDQLQCDDLLAFAGVSPAKVLAIPRAQQFAEKIHAYTYPWDDRENTRSRDLIDLLILIERDLPSVPELRKALDATFNARATHSKPKQLPRPPAGWTLEYEEMAAEIQLTTATLDGAYERLSDLWDQYLA